MNKYCFENEFVLTDSQPYILNSIGGIKGKIKL